MKKLIVMVFLGISACAAPKADPFAASSNVAISQAERESFLDKYELGASDQIRVMVYGEPQLSGQYLVNDRGRIIMPLIGEVTAAGLSIDELCEQITQELTDGYLVDAQVAAEIVEFRPYYILGEINNGGQFEFRVGMTVTKAIAAAGGFTYRANRSVAFIKRSGATDEVKVDISDGVRVEPGDEIRVKERFF
ncbi:MAG: polysaccharide biosynthesis/export family protein [Pseudomonadota bacterium]